MSPIAPCRSSRFTPDDVMYTVRDAIRAGAIPDLTVTEFDEALDDMAPGEREAYVQELWDRL